ncbi:GIP [Symbiodinium microadriaticum]|nr:GIP [Symbiodinium microadriaticum]
MVWELPGALACIPLTSGWSLLSEEALHLEDSERWYWSECHGQGLRRPRFLDCEGGSWDPSWASFRKELQEDPPGRQLLEARAPGAATAELAQQLLQSWTGEMEVEPVSMCAVAALVYSFVIGSVASDSDFRPDVWEVAQGWPVENSCLMQARAQFRNRALAEAAEGFMSDLALEGFCLYGLEP